MRRWPFLGVSDRLAQGARAVSTLIDFVGGSYQITGSAPPRCRSNAGSISRSSPAVEQRARLALPWWLLNGPEGGAWRRHGQVQRGTIPGVAYPPGRNER